jgi:tetratricopeptide (TPR) repeat protein
MRRPAQPPSPPWFERLLDMRRDISPRPTIETWDSGLLVAACPQGHEVSHIVVVPGFRADGIDSIVAYIERAPDLGACQSCGEPLQTRTFAFGTWLPVARREVMVLAERERVQEIVVHDRADHAEIVDTTHPVLGEIAPCTHTRAARLALSDDTEAIRDKLEEVVERFPDYVPALLEMAACEKALGHSEEARRWIERAIDRDPTEARAHFMLGDLLDETSDLDAALHAYDCAIALDPADPQAYVQRGIVLRRMDRPADALAAYERGLAIDAHHALLLFNKMVLHHFSEEPEAVLECLEMIRPSDVEDAEMLAPRLLQITQEHAGRAAEAEDWLKAIRLFALATLFDPEDARTWSNLAICQSHANLWSEAAASLRRVVELEPERPNIAQRLRDCEETVRTMKGDALVAIRSRHTVVYDDAHGNERRMLGYVVKIETHRHLAETMFEALTLEKDDALLKLLVAKGHNRRVAQGRAGRPIVYFVQEPPNADFLALAGALSWCTVEGKVIESAAVPVYMGPPDEALLLTEASPLPFAIPRAPALERGPGDVFYPPEYANY